MLPHYNCNYYFNFMPFSIKSFPAPIIKFLLKRNCKTTFTQEAQYVYWLLMFHAGSCEVDCELTVGTSMHCFGEDSRVIFICFYLQRRKRQYDIIFQKKISALQFVTQRGNNRERVLGARKNDYFSLTLLQL